MLPHELLEHYLAEIEAAVSQMHAYTENYIEEILTPERANHVGSRLATQKF